MYYALHRDGTVYAFDTRRQRRRFLRVTGDCEAITKKAFENLPPPLQVRNDWYGLSNAIERTLPSLAKFTEAAAVAAASIRKGGLIDFSDGEITSL